MVLLSVLKKTFSCDVQLMSYRLLSINLLFLVSFLGWSGQSTAQEDLAEQEEQALRSAVAAVAPSVLRIETVGGVERIGEFLVGEGPTTGLVVAADGYLVSSAFNFAQEPSSILVTLPSGKRAPAEIVARDRSRMLVLLKVTTDEPLVVPTPVPADQMRVGQWALAVGRTLDPNRPNTSVGIVSALQRIWGRAIQTDAKISPNNYGGPLIDIQGRVLGILVPMSPQGGGPLAGVDWYDSGIGFAVPLTDVFRNLERLKSGSDVHPGLLGISLTPGSLYATPPTITGCQPRSPADMAGLKAGDKIVEVAGRAIVNQADLKHALGPLYAGDQVPMMILRGQERIPVTATLTDQLLPYNRPLLGLLPDRSASDLRVRALIAESGADRAGLQVGDRILQFQGQPTTTAAALRQAVADLEVGVKVKLAIERNQMPIDLEVELGTLPESLTPVKATMPVPPNPSAAASLAKPAAETVAANTAVSGTAASDTVTAETAAAGTAVPAATAAATQAAPATQAMPATQATPAATPPATPATSPAPATPAAGQADPAAAAAATESKAASLVDLVEIQVPGEPNLGVAVVPKSTQANPVRGLLVELEAPGDFKREALPERWAQLADEFGLIILAVQPANTERWQPTEVAVIRKLMDEAIKRYNIAPERVVVHGRQAGGAMAYLTAFQHRDLVRAVAVVDAPIPGRVTPPDTSPSEPLAFFSAVSPNSQLAKRVDQVVAALRARKHPVTTLELDADTTTLSNAQRRQLVVWIDALDRI